MAIMTACQTCFGEGKLYTSRYGGNDPDVWCIGKCEACDGEAFVKAHCECCRALAISEHRGPEGQIFLLCQECLDDYLADQQAEERAA